MAYGKIRPIPEIFTDLIGQVTSLVRKEGQLAPREISKKRRAPWPAWR
ncbi:MAG: phage holin family protein [Rhodospirillaceae bacterium]|nr:phage holin family protein [Rhodospirillaceae bacterium]